MEAKGCKEHTVRMTKLCQSDYKKASRRMDRRLRELVEFELGALHHDPYRGSRLERDLTGMHSVHIPVFPTGSCTR